MAVFQINFMAKTLGRTVPLHVILPTDKVYFPGMEQREAGKPYKTLYLLHGIIGNYTDWLYGTRIQRWAEERDLAVVMPSADNFCYLDQPWNGNFYGEFIGKELVEFTRKTFPLSHSKEDTFIGGLSMGGYGAMRNGLKYNETFGSIISLSAAMLRTESIKNKIEKPLFFAQTQEFNHSIYGPDLDAAINSDVNTRVLVNQLLAGKKDFPNIYMACGESDSLLAENQEFHEFLTSQGVNHEFHVGPGSHEWDFWDTYIKKALDWLPLEDKESGVSSGNVGL